MTPTKNGESPRLSDASVMVLTRISDITPAATPAPANMMTLRRTVHGSSPWRGGSDPLLRGRVDPQSPVAP
jgi:hypothetical protein